MIDGGKMNNYLLQCKIKEEWYNTLTTEQKEAVDKIIGKNKIIYTIKGTFGPIVNNFEDNVNKTVFKIISYKKL